MKFIGIKSVLVTTTIFLVFIAKGGSISSITTQPGTPDLQMLQEMGNVSNEVTPYQSTALSDSSSPNPTITLNTPGIYRLSANMTKPIVITSSNVSLNLNGYGITINTAGLNAISVSPATGTLSNVTIRNGYVNGSGVSNAGVYVDSIDKIVTKIFIRDMRFSEFDHGLQIAGTYATDYPKLCEITSCTADNNSVAGFTCYTISFSIISNCYALDNERGFYFFGRHNLVKNCMAMLNRFVGFELNALSAIGNLVTNCIAIENQGPGFRIGSVMGLGVGNLLEYSMAMANDIANFDVQGNNSEYQNREIDLAGIFSWINNVAASP